MSMLFRGAPVASVLNEQTGAIVAELRERCGYAPALAVVRAGERPDDLAYERSAVKRCEALGMRAVCRTLSGDDETEALLRTIAELNADETVDGILLLRPLPGQMDERAACDAILPEKDVDGAGMLSMGRLYAGVRTFAPCTARACMEVLRYYGVDPAGKRVVVVGRSLVVGRAVALLALQADATVTVCHSKSMDLPKITRCADIVVCAVGRAGFFDAAYFTERQTVLDVGMHAMPDGTLCGDVRFEEAEGLVRAITPVPGGIGAVTTAVLLQNVALSAAFRRNT